MTSDGHLAGSAEHFGFAHMRQSVPLARMMGLLMIMKSIKKCPQRETLNDCSHEIESRNFIQEPSLKRHQGGTPGRGHQRQGTGEAPGRRHQGGGVRWLQMAISMTPVAGSRCLRWLQVTPDALVQNKSQKSKIRPLRKIPCTSRCSP